MERARFLNFPLSIADAELRFRRINIVFNCVEC